MVSDKGDQMSFRIVTLADHAAATQVEGEWREALVDGMTAGTWDFVFSDSQADYDRTIELGVEGDKITAKWQSEEWSGTVKDGAFELSGEHTPPEAGYAGNLRRRRSSPPHMLAATPTFPSHRRR